VVTATLVLGGARSGKSRHAEALALATASEALYVATATAGDAEMAARIRHHQAARDARFTLVEEKLELAALLDREARAGRPVLVDCLTLWLMNLMEAGRDPAAETDRLVASVGRLAGPAIVPDNALARAFCDHAGRLNQAMAAACSRVVFVAAGMPLVLKPGGAAQPLHP